MLSPSFKIAVVGTACVDRIYSYGDLTPYIKQAADGSFRLGGKVTPELLRVQPGGSAVNSHRAIYAIGQVFGANVETVMCTRLGRNNPGKYEVEQHLKNMEPCYLDTTGGSPSYDVSINFVMVNGKETTERFISRTDLHDEAPPPYIATLLATAVTESNIVVVNSKPLPEAVIALDAAIKADTTVILDYSPDIGDAKAMETLAPYLPKVSYVVLPSDTFLPGMTLEQKGDIPTLKQRLIHMGCQHFLISDEARDVHVWDNGQDRNITPPKLKAIDPNGAGDVRNAALAVGLAMGKSFYEAAQMSCKIATLSTSTSGGTWVLHLEPFAHEHGLI